MFSNEGFTWLWTPILVNTSKTRFLLDPWTIIVYPCHKLLTDWPTESILFFWLDWCGSWWRKTPTPTCFLLLLLLPTAWRQLDNNLFKTAWFYKRQPKHSTHGSVVPLTILSTRPSQVTWWLDWWFFGMHRVIKSDLEFWSRVIAEFSYQLNWGRSNWIQKSTDFGIIEIQKLRKLP